MMKKILLLVLICLTMGTTYAASNMKLPPHIEYRNYGVYGILDYTHYFTLTEVDFLPEFSGFNAWNAVLGFQIRKETAIGLGFTYLSEPSGGLTQVPVFVELRSHLTRDRLSPFTVLSVGYSFPTGSYSGGQQAVSIETGGVNFGLSAGARFAINRNLGVNLHVGYKMLSMRDVRVNDAPLTPASDEALLLHNITVGVGINF